MAKLLVILIGLVALTSVLCLAEDTTRDVTSGNSSDIARSTPTNTKPLTPSSATSVTPTSSHTPTPTPVPHNVTTTTPVPHNVTTTPVPHNATSTPVVTPTPHITPTPSPVTPPTPQYKLVDSKNKSRNCIVVDANITFAVGFEVLNKTQYGVMYIPLVNATVNVTGSYCNVSVSANHTGNWKALMELTWTFDKQPFTVDFMFNADTNTGSRQWNLKTTTVHIPAGLFSNVSVQHRIKEGDFLVANSTEMMDQQLDYERSYQCNARRNLTMTVTNTSAEAVFYNVTISVEKFQVQAFEFRYPLPKSELFNNAASCPNDSGGNKIVPIAVGAALAGLVIIVLVAYIIGRLRSRKQSSYEALS